MVTFRKSPRVSQFKDHRSSQAALGDGGTANLSLPLLPHDFIINLTSLFYHRM